MTTFIIEDEKPAVEQLTLLLKQQEPEVRVLGVANSVRDSINWLSTHQHPDFILLDIHFGDGSAFDIFRRIPVNVPLIFTTAYDQYSLDAFALLTIDYLLKPVTATALSQAIQKLRLLRQSITPAFNYNEVLLLLQQQQQCYKTRFIGKVGVKLFFIDSGDISYFMADDKIVYLYTNDGNRYIIDYTLEMLETMIDPKQYFRINRSVIVKAMAIDQVKPYVNSRLKIVLKTKVQTQEVIVSRERVSGFKTWAAS